MGHFDGIFYWLEIKKPLNNQDGPDWDLSFGDTYGYADSPIDTEEHLCLRLHDQSEDYDVQAFIQITKSSPEARNIILRVHVYSAIIILATILAIYIK